MPRIERAVEWVRGEDGRLTVQIRFPDSEEPPIVLSAWDMRLTCEGAWREVLHIKGRKP